jgi:hypothetical protein
MDEHTAQLYKTARELRMAMLVVLAVQALVGLLVILTLWAFDRPLPYLLGLAAGGGISAFRLRLLQRSLVKTLDMDSDTAQNMTRLQFALRYFLTAALVAVVVFLRSYVSLIGTLVGILSLQFAVYLVGYMERRRESQRFAEQGYPPPLPDDEDQEEDDFDFL